MVSAIAPILHSVSQGFPTTITQVFPAHHPKTILPMWTLLAATCVVILLARRLLRCLARHVVALAFMGVLLVAAVWYIPTAPGHAWLITRGWFAWH